MPQPAATVKSTGPVAAPALARKQSRTTVAALLFVLTCLTFLVHGYHFGIEDEAIYLPAVKKQLNAALYPHDAEMFLSKTRATLFPQIIALSVRATRVPLEYAEFAWHFASMFLLLLGCWRIACRCFVEPHARWAAVAFVASLLTLPVAGTSLYLADQHLGPRNLAVAALLLAIGSALDRRWIALGAWCGFAFLMNPLVAVFGFSYLVFLLFPFERWAARFAAALPFVARPTEAWRQAAYTRAYYFLRNWAWYEWLGSLRRSRSCGGSVAWRGASAQNSR